MQMKRARHHSLLDTTVAVANVARLNQTELQARSSVVEHYLDTVGVGGSIPPVPTIGPQHSAERRECYSSVVVSFTLAYALRADQRHLNLVARPFSVRRMFALGESSS
jgi:hypothetical protein